MESFSGVEGDSVLPSSDYSQIELRVLAYRDEHLIEAFRHGADIHTSTAMRVFWYWKKPEDVTPNDAVMLKLSTLVLFTDLIVDG